MPYEHMSVGERIKRAAQKIGGLNKLSEKAGIPRRTLSDYVADKTEPKLSTLVEIARVTSSALEWIVDGDEQFADDQGSPAPASLAPGSKAIPNILTHAGMGNGGLELVEVNDDGRPHDLYTDGDWSFPAGIAGGFRHFKGVYALEVEGDSMEPTYAGGSTVFVDTRRKDPRSAGCFIVDYGDGLMLKRIELIGGTDLMAVISDNRDLYRSYEFPRDLVTIWGRVIAKWEWVK